MIFKILICFIAGIGAGLGTGFAGMSAAAVISPMLITFLGLPAYEAVGIALASDVLASAVSAYTYGKSGNLDIRNGLVMMAAVLTFTLVGSWAASLVPNTTMGNFSVVMTFSWASNLSPSRSWPPGRPEKGSAAKSRSSSPLSAVLAWALSAASWEPEAA